MRVTTSYNGLNDLHVSPRRGWFWYITNAIITGDLGQVCPNPRYKGPNGEVLHWLSCKDLYYIDHERPNRVWIKNRSGYIRNAMKNKSFGVVSVCHGGKWYSVENKGYIEVGPYHKRWWNIEINPFTEEDLNGGVIPEIINCKKNATGDAECWFE